MSDLKGEDAYSDLLCVNNLLLGAASHEEEELAQPTPSSKKDAQSSVPVTKSTLPAALDAMEIDDPPPEQEFLMDNLKRLGKMFKASNKSVAAALAGTTNSTTATNNNKGPLTTCPFTPTSHVFLEDHQVSACSVVESIKEKIMSSDDIEFSFESFPYYLSEKVRERLKCITTVYFTHQDFVPFMHTIEALNRRVLLTGPSGTSRCMAAIVAAVAKDSNADLLTFNWDLVNADGDDENEEDGAGDEALDEYDLYEEFEQRFRNTAEVTQSHQWRPKLMDGLWCRT